MDHATLRLLIEVPAGTRRTSRALRAECRQALGSGWEVCAGEDPQFRDSLVPPGLAAAGSESASDPLGPGVRRGLSPELAARLDL